MLPQLARNYFVITIIGQDILGKLVANFVFVL